MANGTFIMDKDNKMLLQFKRKIRLVDPRAGFMVNANVKAVSHSLCSQTVTMKEPYNTAHFIRHTGTCRGLLKTTHSQKNTSVQIPSGNGILRFPPTFADQVCQEEVQQAGQLLPKSFIVVANTSSSQRLRKPLFEGLRSFNSAGSMTTMKNVWYL